MSLPPVSGPSSLATQAASGFAQRHYKTAATPEQMKLQIANEPLSLVYRTAIQQLNERLKAELGPDAIQGAVHSGIDFSPEAVAERILSFATAGFASYRERHPDEEHGGRLDGFMALIRDAIDQGFAEAREILDGLGVLNGNVKANADRTYELIQNGLDRFEQDSREIGG